MQYALKFTQTQLDNKRYNSLIDLLGLDIVYDIGEKNDIGFNTTLTHDWKQKLYQTSYGLYTGYKLFKNSWLTVGYNFSEYKDNENSINMDSYTGVYLKLRMKFDQSSLREITHNFM